MVRPSPNFILLNHALEQTGWKGRRLEAGNWRRALKAGTPFVLLSCGLYFGGMTEEEYRIQKISVPVSCHTARDERLEGEIFVDMLSAEGYSLKQVIDFFNAHSHFFPIKTRDHARPILLNKASVVKVEVPGGMERFLEEASAAFARKRDAVVHMRRLGPIHVTLILDLPEGHSRILDLLSLPSHFFSAIIHDSFCLLNAHHTYKIEEL
jgi:hypothetical protein